jgi:NADPH:quinone reductase-like Zn-dependent oxidoreductase
MQALVLTKSGHASENFHVVNDAQKPSNPGKGDILIKVHSVALNPVDYKQAQYGFLISSFPAVLGCTLNFWSQPATWSPTLHGGCIQSAPGFLLLSTY